jgi:hypothetical protein
VGPLFVVSVAIPLVLAGVALVLLLDPTGDQLRRESPWGALAVAVVVAYPALVALVVRRRCPRLLVGAGLSALLRLPLSFSFLFFPMLVPAVGFLYASRRPCRVGHEPSRHLVVDVALVVFGLAAIVVLFVTQDPVSYTDGDVSGYASDTISTTEGLLSLAFSSVGIAVAALTARTRSLIGR